MAVCEKCGFQFLQAGKPCPACGSGDDAVTIFQPASPSEAVKKAPESRETIIQDNTPKQENRVKQDSKPAVEIIDKRTPSLTPTAGSSRTIPKGQIIDERYEVQDFIGRGGMGSVYRVRDMKEDQILALKILNQVTEDESEQRFMREFELLTKINHPAVLKVYGWGRYQNQLYFVSEFVSGRDLKSEIKKRGPWPAEESAKLVASIADALSVAHAMGIVHRDIKPHNIMISNDGSVRLLDFGVARKTGGGMETLTKTGMIVGTPEYMSPEQFGTHRVDERSDLYSLGVVLFELLTGQIPFGGETPVAIALKVIQQPTVPPQSVRKDIPEWIDRIVVKCLDKDPKNRYVNAAQLAEELRKPNVKPRPTMRRLPNGDSVVLDTSEDAKIALILASEHEKLYWTVSMALRFSDGFYKLQEIFPPGVKGPRWFYHFSKWPQEEILRGLIDYDQHTTNVPTGKPSFLKKLFGKS